MSQFKLFFIAILMYKLDTLLLFSVEIYGVIIDVFISLFLFWFLSTDFKFYLFVVLLIYLWDVDQLILIYFSKFILLEVFNIQILYFHKVSLVKFFVNPWVIFWNYIFYYTVHFKSLFLHFLVMWSTLIMSPCLYKVRHHLKNTTKSLFFVSWCKLLLKIRQENDIFEFFFFRPMTFFLICNMIFQGSSMNKKRQDSFLGGRLFYWRFILLNHLVYLLIINI